MYRKTLLVAVATLWTLAAAGCELYFDDHNRGNDGGYTYCDETGCYTCDDWGCYPSGNGGGSGWTCNSDADCAAGCYCDPATGTCQEGGFCTFDSDCPDGFHCDDRSSCVPDGNDNGCQVDGDCATGSYCDTQSGQCVGSSECTEDGQCPLGQQCDETRGTCVPSPDACGADGSCPDGQVCDTTTNTCQPASDQAMCQAPVTCTEAPPACPDGSNPGIVNGCYNGECIADADCPDGAPVQCSDHTDEASCMADDACDSVYRGINCTDPNGNSCTSTDANCTCERFVFQSCVDAGTAP